MRGMLHGERADGRRSALRPRRPSATPAARPGTPADPHRRRRRAGDAQAGGPLRRRVQRGRRRREREAQGGVLLQHCETVGRDRPRSSERPASGRSSSATPARRRSGVQRGDLRRERRGPPLEGPAGRDARGRRGAARALPRTRLSAPHRRLPVAVRRGVDDAAPDRGPAAARARLGARVQAWAARRRRRAGLWRGGGPPWRGCRTSSCRTSADGPSASRRRRPSGSVSLAHTRIRSGWPSASSRTSGSAIAGQGVVDRVADVAVVDAPAVGARDELDDLAGVERAVHRGQRGAVGDAPLDDRVRQLAHRASHGPDLGEVPLADGRPRLVDRRGSGRRPPGG